MRYSFRTPVGTVSIVSSGGRFHVLFFDEDLGDYASPADAARSVAGIATNTPADECGMTNLGISKDLSDWTED